MESSVQKHVDDISRSLEKICDIIDEHAKKDGNWSDGWGPRPDFLRLIPMRYRVGDYVIELTAMNKWDHEAVNKFDVTDISCALKKALQIAADVPRVMTDVAFIRESGDRWNPDDENLKSIVTQMVGSIDVPSMDKATLDCVSVLLRKEIQNMVDNKLSDARINLGNLPEDGRLTRSRSRSSRSHSPHNLTPGSSWDAPDRWDPRPCPASNSGCWENCQPGNDATWDCGECESRYEEPRVHSAKGCWAPFLDGGDFVAPQWVKTEAESVKEIRCGTWGCGVKVCACRETKIGSTASLDESPGYRSPRTSNTTLFDCTSDISDSQFSSQRSKSRKTQPRGARRNVVSQKPRQSAWSLKSSKAGSPIARRVQTMSLNDDSELDNVTRVPEPKIYTATTTSPNSTQYPVPAAHIVHMDAEDVWNGRHQARQGRITWSNGSIDVIWMDELSKRYPQQLIQYYEKTLPLKNNIQFGQQYQPTPQGVSNFNSGYSNVPSYPTHPQQSVQHPTQHAGPGFQGSYSGDNNIGTSAFNINHVPHSKPGPFGMNSSNMSNTTFGGNGYDGPRPFGYARAPPRNNFYPW